jgi:hypothetical protein
MRCSVCGNLISLFPCRICASRQAKHSDPFLSPGGLESFPFWEGEETAEDIFDLQLTDDTLARYQEMRRKVEAEIAAGTRTADTAHPHNQYPKRR